MIVKTVKTVCKLVLYGVLLCFISGYWQLWCARKQEDETALTVLVGQEETMARHEFNLPEIPT